MMSEADFRLFPSLYKTIVNAVGGYEDRSENFRLLGISGLTDVGAKVCF